MDPRRAFSLLALLAPGIGCTSSNAGVAAQIPDGAARAEAGVGDSASDVADAPESGGGACTDAAAFGADARSVACFVGAPPEAGAVCPSPGVGSCEYVVGCGGMQFSCCTSTWGVEKRPPSCTLCPATAPMEAACGTENLYCAYASAQYCDETAGYCTNGRWMTITRPCLPSCPATEPKEGDPCAQTGMYCQWPSPCHGRARADCIAGRAQVTLGCP